MRRYKYSSIPGIARRREGTNVETHGVRLNAHPLWRMRNVLKGLLRWIGRKREIKHGWNRPLTPSASKKE
ncbi:MAG: hypothetical protein LBF89_07300 [Bacteroidales bacterium]|nr:hypothetical protein [Bacteroidales bacterium]